MASLYIDKLLDSMVTSFAKNADQIQLETRRVWACDLKRELGILLTNTKEETQTQFLQSVMDALLNPLYKQLKDADPEKRKALNDEIRRVKLTINRGLQAYNKTVEGQSAPFLTRIVALANPAGRQKGEVSESISESSYKENLEKLSDQELYEELIRITHLRHSFLVRLIDKNKLKKAGNNIFSTLGKNEKEQIIDLLSSLYKSKLAEGEEFCNKSYVIVDYKERALLNKVKTKWKKQLSFWLRLAMSSVIGLSEGLVAGFALYGFLIVIPGIGLPLVIGLSIFAGVSGAFVNIPTLFNDGIEPFKNLLNGRLLGEPGERLTGKKKVFAQVLIASTLGYGLALGIFTAASFVGILSLIFPAALPVIIAVAVIIGVISTGSLSALFLNVATNFVKQGGFERLIDLYNFKKLKQEFFESNPNMSTAAKWAAFLFFKVFFERILGSIAVIATLYGFSLSTGSDALSFGKSGGYVLAISAIVISALIYAIFNYDKMCRVYTGIKQALFGTREDAIFYFNEDKKLQFSAENLGKYIIKLTNSLVLMAVKIASFSVAASVMMAVSILAFVFVGLPVSLVKNIRKAADPKYKKHLEEEKINNHEVNAVSKRTSNDAIKKVSSLMLSLFGIANGIGQGALSSTVAIMDKPGPLGSVGNIAMGAIAASTSTVSSCALNSSGCNEALEAVLGKTESSPREAKNFSVTQADKWADFAKTISHLVFAMAHMFVKNGRVEDRKKLAQQFSLFENKSEQSETPKAATPVTS